MADDMVDQYLQEAISELDDMYNSLTVGRSKKQNPPQQKNCNSLPSSSGKVMSCQQTHSETSSGFETNTKIQDGITNGLLSSNQTEHPTAEGHECPAVQDSSLTKLDQSIFPASPNVIQNNQIETRYFTTPHKHHNKENLTAQNNNFSTIHEVHGFIPIQSSTMERNNIEITPLHQSQFSQTVNIEKEMLLPSGLAISRDRILSNESDYDEVPNDNCVSLTKSPSCSAYREPPHEGAIEFANLDTLPYPETFPPPPNQIDASTQCSSFVDGSFVVLADGYVRHSSERSGDDVRTESLFGRYPALRNINELALEDEAARQSKRISTTSCAPPRDVPSPTGSIIDTTAKKEKRPPKRDGCVIAMAISIIVAIGLLFFMIIAYFYIGTGIGSCYENFRDIQM